MNLQQVAAYLTMDVRRLLRWASRGQIPCRRVGQEEYVFRKSELDHWVWEQMHNFSSRALEGIERGVSEHHGIDHEKPIVCPLIPEDGVAVPLEAKTRQSALNALLDLADRCDLLYNREELSGELAGREQICSTAMLPGVAFPHPRHPLPWDIAESFVIVGVTSTGLPFGAQDGSLTRLFFMVCCKDETTHLHVLARLVRMLDDRGLLEELIAAPDAARLEELLAHREMEMLHQS